MRDTTRRDSALQIALALLLAAPLMAAFIGGGPVELDALTWARIGVLARAFGRSVQLGVTSAGVAALLGIPAAWLLASRRVSVLLIALFVLPLALPAPVAVSGWVRLLAPSAASSFALQNPGTAHSFLFSVYGAGIVLGFGLWPVVALHVWPGFARARDASYDAARLYAPPSRAFFQTILPRCRGEILAGLSLVFLLASNDFATSSLLLVNTLPVEVHDQAALGKYSVAAWTSLPLIMMAALVCVLMTQPSNDSQASIGNAARAHGRTGRGAAIVLVLGLVFGFLIPMLSCMHGVLSSGKALSVSFDAGAESLGLSARLAAAAVLIAVGMAAARIVFWPETRAHAVTSAGLFLLAIPGTFLGVALFSLQLDATSILSGLQQPLAWMAAGLALRFLYVPLRLADEAVASIDPSILESAALLGHGRTSKAMGVVLPLSSGHLAAAAALVFALVLGEVPVASILAPPGAAPATIWLFGQQHMGYDESVFALSLLLGVTTAVVIALGAWLGKRAVL
ncbi:MAG: hypothetical protein WCT04_20155 [Planctomycetota bacterium]